jgi:hypothetical protein
VVHREISIHETEENIKKSFKMKSKLFVISARLGWEKSVNELTAFEDLTMQMKVFVHHQPIFMSIFG